MIASLPEDTAGRPPHEEDRHQQLHRLSHRELYAAAQVRRGRLERHHRADEARQRLRRLSSGPSTRRTACSTITRRSWRPISRAHAGPAESAMKIKLRPRPAGRDRAGGVQGIRRVRSIPIVGLPQPRLQQRRQRLVARTPSVASPARSCTTPGRSRRQSLVHLQRPESPHHHRQIDGKTGDGEAVQGHRRSTGLPPSTHGMTRDPQRHHLVQCQHRPWRPGPARPQDRTIDVYMPPKGMSPTGGATTVDYDGKGKIWSSAPDGALRFDPETETFTEFKSITSKTPNGTGMTYGAAGDRDGNGWWAEMTIDIIGKGDVATGKVAGSQARRRSRRRWTASRRRRAILRDLQPPDFNTRSPGRRARGAWAPTRRRRLWVGNSWGGKLARIDTRTHGDDVSAAARRPAALSRGGRRASTMPGPTSGAPTRGCATIRRPTTGRHSTCRRGAASRATCRCWSAMARRRRWSCRTSARARSRS